MFVKVAGFLLMLSGVLIGCIIWQLPKKENKD
jgi:hypothetical protein